MTTVPLDPARRYTVDAACDYLGICRANLYNKVRAGQLKVIRDGRRTFVPGAEIARLCQTPQG